MIKYCIFYSDVDRNVSKAYNERVEVIRNYQEYKTINEFYTELERRHNYLLQDKYYYNSLKIYNQECLDLADKAVKNVNCQG